MEDFEGIYDDPEAEFNEWRTFYAKQFEGDPAMEEYLQNIDAEIAFEDILKDNDSATIENLVEECKFLESAETLQEIELPFPWKTPTKARSPPPTTTTVAVQTTFSLAPVNHIGRDATTDKMEETVAFSFESRLLNSFVGVVQRRGGLVGGIKKFHRGVRSGGMKVWRVVTCRRKRSGEESEKQSRWDV